MSTDIFDLQTASAYLGISPRSLRARCKKRQVAHARDGRRKASATRGETSVTSVTVIARVIYDDIFNIKSPVKSSAELIPTLKKGPRAISRLLSRWATEPQKRVYFQVIPAGLDSHDEVLKFTLTRIVK
jgi:hypothetical protein